MDFIQLAEKRYSCKKYGERAVEYLSSRRGVSIYRVFWTGAIVLGSIMSLGLVWNIADIMNALMAIPNLVSLLLLSNVIVRETNHYLWGNRLDEVSEENQDAIEEQDAIEK